MKTRERTETPTRTIRWWYDPSYGWVVNIIDENGEQVGAADYVGHKSALQHGIEFAAYQIAKGC